MPFGKFGFLNVVELAAPRLDKFDRIILEFLMQFRVVSPFFAKFSNIVGVHAYILIVKYRIMGLKV